VTSPAAWGQTEADTSGNDPRAAPGTPARRIPLDGAVNFRDLGGYPAPGGRSVRWRALFRADDLSCRSRPDREVVRRLGIATVIDLRSRAEVERDRFPVAEIAVAFHHVPLVAALPAFEEFRRGPTFFGAHYLDIARQAGDQIARALAIVADRDAQPVIVHCAAGKDRTGVLVAVILALLGVDDGVIAEDYALSAAAMDTLLGRILERMPEQREVIMTVADVMFSAQPEAIIALLDGLRDEYGSVEAYAASYGAGEQVLEELRASLLEPGPG
jgi:protein-tyrosine phosphatase